MTDPKPARKLVQPPMPDKAYYAGMDGWSYAVVAGSLQCVTGFRVADHERSWS